MVSHAQALLVAAKPAPNHNEETQQPSEGTLCFLVLGLHHLHTTGVFQNICFCNSVHEYGGGDICLKEQLTRAQSDDGDSKSVTAF